MPKIVILDGYTTNPGDLSWEPIAQLGDLEVYDRTPNNLILEQAQNANIVIVNKTKLDREQIGRLQNMKLICTLATGYNNIDIEGANDFDVTVCNAVGYSTPSVAQHVFSLLLEITNQVALHNQSVQSGGWANSSDWCYWKQPLMELAGKTMGMVVYDHIIVSRDCYFSFREEQLI